MPLTGRAAFRIMKADPSLAQRARRKGWRSPSLEIRLLNHGSSSMMGRRFLLPLQSMRAGSCCSLRTSCPLVDHGCRWRATSCSGIPPCSTRQFIACGVRRSGCVARSSGRRSVSVFLSNSIAGCIRSTIATALLPIQGRIRNRTTIGGDWEKYGDLWRWLLIVNQTFLGRLFIGPFLQTPRLYIEEVRKLIAGDTANAGIWVRHFIGLPMILLLVTRVFDMSVVRHLAEFVYTGLVFGMMRSFTEHRWVSSPANAPRWLNRTGCSVCCFYGTTFTSFITSFLRCRGGKYLAYGASIVSASRRTTADSCFEATARSPGDGSSSQTSFPFIHPASQAGIRRPDANVLEPLHQRNRTRKTE